MNTARYVIAVLMLVTFPPSILLWFAIHPFVKFWRRLGPAWTYAILIPLAFGMMFWLYGIRTTLVWTDLGTKWFLVAAGAICIGFGLVIAIKRKKYLTARILGGIPELSTEAKQGTLLTEGIYGKIRHPRYVEVIVSALGYAFISNYLGFYVLVGASVITLYAVVVFEERELLDRFGDEYREYCRRVPRFVPRY